MALLIKNSILYAAYFLGLLAPVFLLPLIVAIYFGELREATSFSIVFLVLVGLVAFSRNRVTIEGFSKSQYLLSLFFIFPIAALICSIPFLFAGFNFFDAVFDAMSGWTTTGITLHSDSVCQSLLFFRSFLQWIGGFGFIFFASLILKGTFQQKELGTYFNKIKETQGISMKSFPQKIFGVYTVLTVICFSLLLLSGMAVFDAINLAMVTLSTGGFFWYTSFSDIQKIILIVFMLLGATCFILFLMRKNFIKTLLLNIEFRIMVVLVALGGCVFMISYNLNLVDSVFLAAAALSGMGIVPANIYIDQLSPLAMLVLGGLMITGGSYSSTAGGLKLWRVIIYIKTISAEIKKYLLPENTVVPVTFERQTICEADRYNVFMYINIFFIFLLISSSLFLIFDRLELFQSLFLSAALMTNAGIMVVDLSSLSFVSQCLSFFLMWVGRIELLGVLIFIGRLLCVVKERRLD